MKTLIRLMVALTTLCWFLAFLFIEFAIYNFGKLNIAQHQTSLFVTVAFVLSFFTAMAIDTKGWNGDKK